MRDMVIVMLNENGATEEEVRSFMYGYDNDDKWEMAHAFACALERFKMSNLSNRLKSYGADDDFITSVMKYADENNFDSLFEIVARLHNENANIELIRCVNDLLEDCMKESSI